MCVTFSTMKFLHPNQVCVCCPAMWDNKCQRVATWFCLLAVSDIDTARAALARLELDGIRNLVAISTSDEVIINGDLATRFFRVYYGMQ